jgi:spore coat polysaccharide biosynthesis protein SpsF
LKTGIIVQARVGSSRLPFKVVLPFDQTDAIIEIILRALKSNSEGIPVVLATTYSGDDDVLCKVASNMENECFQGPEEDVLGRFILAAEKYGFERILRICADNPFLDVPGTIKLLEEDPGYDYVAYRMQGNIPSIKSHLGLWGEVVTLDALKKVRNETSAKTYYEHVTNFIYGHPEKFKIKWIDATDFLFRRNDVRLTIDDDIDFNLGKELMYEMKQAGLTLEPGNIVSFLDDHPQYLEIMRDQINKYTK